LTGMVPPSTKIKIWLERGGPIIIFAPG